MTSTGKYSQLPEGHCYEFILVLRQEEFRRKNEICINFLKTRNFRKQKTKRTPSRNFFCCEAKSFRELFLVVPPYR